MCDKWNFDISVGMDEPCLQIREIVALAMEYKYKDLLTKVKR